MKMKKKSYIRNNNYKLIKIRFNFGKERGCHIETVERVLLNTFRTINYSMCKVFNLETISRVLYISFGLLQTFSYRNKWALKDENNGNFLIF